MAAIQSIAGSLGDKIIKAQLITSEKTFDFGFEMHRKGESVDFSYEIIIEQDENYMEKATKNASLKIVFDGETIIFPIEKFNQKEVTEDD